MKCIPLTDGITGKAASTLARLKVRVWTSLKLSVKTNMAMFNACVISTLLCGRETWTTYAGQERKLNTFHLRSIRHILAGQSNQRWCPVSACLPSVYTPFRQRIMRWLCHVRRMKDGRIPKYILYGELTLGRSPGRPHLRYKYVCVRDMKAVDIDPMFWVGLQLIAQSGGVP